MRKMLEQAYGRATLIQREDLLLLSWLIVFEPFLEKLLAKFLGNRMIVELEPGTTESASFALLFLCALALAFVAVGTRSGEAEKVDDKRVKSSRAIILAFLVPPLATHLYLGLKLIDKYPGDYVMVTVFVFIYFAIANPSRLPQLPGGVRRILIAPLLITSTWLVTTISQVVIQEMRNEAPPIAVLVLLLILAMIGYTFFVFAPRMATKSAGSPRAWAVRFLLFLAGLYLNVRWLQKL